MSDHENGPDESQQLPSYPTTPYPSAPPVSDLQPTAAANRPMEITLAFWGWLVSALIVVIGGLFVLGQKQQIINALNQANANAQLHGISVESEAHVAMITAVVVEVVIGLLYVFFAFKLRDGRNWARIVLTVIAALNLINLLTNSDTAGVLSYLGELISVAAAVASYLPKSNAYIQQSKRAKAGQVLGR